MTTPKLDLDAAEKLARYFHETYEQLAPQFGYATRAETREFRPESSNGRLMIAVCEEMLRTFIPLAVERVRELEHEVIVWRDNFHSEEPWRRSLQKENATLRARVAELERQAADDLAALDLVESNATIETDGATLAIVRARIAARERKGE